VLARARVCVCGGGGRGGGATQQQRWRHCCAATAVLTLALCCCPLRQPAALQHSRAACPQAQQRLPWRCVTRPAATHDDAVCAAVVAAGDGAEALLPCCVPLCVCGAAPAAATACMSGGQTRSRVSRAPAAAAAAAEPRDAGRGSARVEWPPHPLLRPAQDLCCRHMLRVLHACRAPRC
jgi:hypothetical protein